ncbi:hypothetical protein ABH909_003534 [Pseudomonas sp. BS3782 TE3695]|uniref:hypothetical protein n=1 Tax=Pseudomonas sp. BS3782 TE3695 TaxID=3349323 RepID=UPI003D201CF3
MKLYTSLFRLTACACLALYGASSAVSASSENSPIPETKATYGDIIFFNSKGEKKCTLSIPETKDFFDFSQSGQSCENNLMASFTLENVPSATFIRFFENENCSDAQTNDNFFIHLKTVKQPTDWGTPPTPPTPTMNFNDFKKREAGDLIPNRYIRVERQWEGSDVANEDWDERISCVYIERSQPVN